MRINSLEKNEAVIDFLKMYNYKIDKKQNSQQLISTFIKENKVDINHNRHLQRSYKEFKHTLKYRVFLSELNIYIQKHSMEGMLKTLDQIDNEDFIHDHKKLNEKLKIKLKANCEQLSYIKNSAVSADAKLSWMIAFFGLVISALVALGIGLSSHWTIIGIVLSFPIASVLILTTQIITHHNERVLDYTFLKVKSRLAIMEIDDKSEGYFDSELEMGSYIEKLTKNINQKDWSVAFAFGLSFPILIPIIFWRFKNRGHKH